jgi:hypothetical protein
LLDRRSLAFANPHLELLPAALRIAVWHAAWCMVRDQQLTPKEYLELFLIKAPLESNPQMVSGFHWNLRTVLNTYLVSDARERYMYRLHNQI